LGNTFLNKEQRRRQALGVRKVLQEGTSLNNWGGNFISIAGYWYA
jgi:hypothetical protein